MSELPEELRNRPARSPGQRPTASLTLDAYLRVKAELEHLTTTDREQVTQKIKIAREHGDLKENAEYHAAKDEQGLMESKIRKLQHLVQDPDIVEAPAQADEILPGMLVTIRPADEDEPDDETYLLAEHAEEKAPGARTVTTSSPLGTALLGAAVDQEVAYDAPAGTVRYVVVGFEPFAG
ncbi:MAG: transcription elongation factor GreA [Actinomycetota bacterium]